MPGRYHDFPAGIRGKLPRFRRGRGHAKLTAEETEKTMPQPDRIAVAGLASPRRESGRATLAEAVA
jgi:hypothetical protein